MCIKVEILTHNIHLSPHYSVHFSFSKIRPWKIFWLIVQFQHLFICKAYCILSKFWWTSVEGMLVQHCWWTRGRASKWQFAEFSFALPNSSLAPLGRDRLLQLHPTRLSFPFCSSQSLLRRSVSQKGILFLPFQSLTSSEPWFERVKLLLSSVDCYTSEYFCSFALPWMKRSQQPQTASTRLFLNGFTRPVTVHTFATYIVIKQQIVVV